MIDIIFALLVGGFLGAGTIYFYGGIRAHRAAEALDREHAEAHRLANDLIARELRDNT